MYGARAEGDDLEWGWVEDQLVNAGAYWAVTPGSVRPHPRPVWGVWHDTELFLSIGSPKIKADAQGDCAVTVHLGSVNDVVIVEGRAAGSTADSHVLNAYNVKYDWNYSVDDYGPLTLVGPVKVIAWRTAGWAGRDGFQATGRWTFPPDPH